MRMLLNIVSKFVPAVLILLASLPAFGKPLPPQTLHNPARLGARSGSSGGGLKPWEIVVIVLGSVVAIVLIGGLGGACEVMLHTRSKIKQSNAEADAKLEVGGNRELELEPGDDKEDGSGSDAPTEVGEVDASRFSWQPEKMTTGEDHMSEGRALSDTETANSSEATLNGEQSSVNGEGEPIHGLDMHENTTNDTDFQNGQTTDRVLPWENRTDLDPGLAQFVIGDEESPDYEREGDAGYNHHQGQFTDPVYVPDEADFQHHNVTTHHRHQESTLNHETDYSQSKGQIEETHQHTGDVLAVAPVGEYSGEGYSPAVMPDEVDYLAEYRQSQLYLQQEDDWQQYYGSLHGEYGTNSEQDGHQAQDGVGPHPNPRYL